MAATTELLVTEGFRATTIQAVARRSGVHAPAIYRRWPSVVELIEAASAQSIKDVTVSATGDLRRDLTRFIRKFQRVFMSPAAKVAIPALLSIYQHEAAAASSRMWANLSLRPNFYEILDAAGAEHVDPKVDRDDVFDMLLAVLLARALLPTVVARRRPIGSVVDLVIRTLRTSDG